MNDGYHPSGSGEDSSANQQVAVSVPNTMGDFGEEFPLVLVEEKRERSPHWIRISGIRDIHDTHTRMHDTSGWVTVSVMNICTADSSHEEVVRRSKTQFVAAAAFFVKSVSSTRIC
jgi:hypothetical protein